MAVPRRKDPDRRWVKTFESPNSLDDDLGGIGAWVGPRRGINKRNQGQMEDYVLRRLLVAWKYGGNVTFPFEIAATSDHAKEPDFLVQFRPGISLGIEVTEAGDADYQAWLSSTEASVGQVKEADIVPFPIFDDAERARQIVEAISRKVERYEKGWYQTPDSCDLVIYDNTPQAGWKDALSAIARIDRRKNLLGGFRQVHLLSDEKLFQDIFGQLKCIDVSKFYEIDFANWIMDQVEHIRSGDMHMLDIDNIVEELESLGKSDRRSLCSHLRNLMLHLLKWEYQSNHRTKSWLRSIGDARSDIEGILDDSPSLKRFFKEQLDGQYAKARKAASRETGLKLETFPEDLPYELEQLLDDEFLPKGDEPSPQGQQP